jgi:hypothetical protein
MHLRKASHILDTVFDAYGVDDGDKLTSRRVGWRARERDKDEDACLHAAEEMFSLHTPIGNAGYFMISDVSGDSCRKIVKRGLRWRHRRRDVHERGRKNCLYEKFVDLILSYSWT